MFRNVFRTSRWLVRKQINSCSTLSSRSYNCMQAFHKSRNITIHNSRLSLARTKSEHSSSQDQVDSIDFDQICHDTLESLCDYFEELIEKAPNLKGADVTYGDGVLTVSLGPNYGTYVINRQSPNKQIWLSSPTSGPKRYDLVTKGGACWIYKHDGMSLHQLLQTEISKIAETEVDFKSCTHSLI